MKGRRYPSGFAGLITFPLIAVALVALAAMPLMGQIPRSPSGRWDLVYFLEEGELGPRVHGLRQWVRFGPGGGLTYSNGCTLYQGDYALAPEGAVSASTRYSSGFGCVRCNETRTHCETFPPEGQSLSLSLETMAWEIRGDQMWLYFVRDKSDGVVLRWAGPVQRGHEVRLRSPLRF